MLRVRLAVLLAMALGVLFIALTPHAHATPGIPGNCDAKPWGFLFTQVRLICDGPVTQDGSWSRTRTIATPAHQVPFTCFHGTYSSSCSGGYWVDTVITNQQTYPVNPSNVLADEPGHLGPANNGAASRSTLA